MKISNAADTLMGIFGFKRKEDDVGDQAIIQAEAERKAEKASYMRGWRAANRENIRVYRKARKDAHPEKVKAYQKAYRDAHPERVREIGKRYHEAHSEKVRVYQKAWYEAHTEKAKASAKAWKGAHPERVKASAKAWYEAHAEGVKSRTKAYYETYPEKVKARNKAWHDTHPEKLRALRERRRARKLDARGADYTTAEHIKGRWAMWGDRCYICGEPAEATDHVIPLARGGSHWPANLRPICRHCNSAKGASWPIPEFI